MASSVPHPAEVTHPTEKMHADKLKTTGPKITDKVYKMCTDKQSVSSLLAQDPTLTPGAAATKLYHPDTVSISEGAPPKDRSPATPEELERAYQCGNFGPTRPSELFLRIFHDSLMPLEHDPLMGVCSPSLIGSSGVMPLTIIGPLPDICRHMVEAFYFYRCYKLS